MGDGLAGFTQGLARGTAQLPDVVNQDRSRIQQADQFSQSLGVEQAKGGIVKDPTSGKYIIDPTSPVGQEMTARLEGTRAQTEGIQADTAGKKADLALMSDPSVIEARKKSLIAGGRSAVAGADTAEANAKVAEPLAQLSVKSAKQNVKLQGLEVLSREFSNEIAPTMAALDIAGKQAGIASSVAATKNMQATGKREDARMAMAAREQAWNQAQSLFQNQLKLTEMGAEERKSLEQTARMAVMRDDEAIARATEPFLQNLAITYGGAENVPPEAKQAAMDFASSVAPNMKRNADYLMSIMKNHPDAAPIAMEGLRAMNRQLAGFAASGAGPEAAPAFNKILDGQALQLAGQQEASDAIDAKAAAQPASQPSAQPPTGKKSLALSPVTTTAGKNQELAQKQAKTKTYLDEALRRSPDQWTKSALDRVVGASSPDEAVAQLNRFNPGHWTLGPNGEIVQMPWSKDLPKLAGMNYNSESLSRAVDDVSKNYTRYLEEMRSQGALGFDDPASPQTVLSVFMWRDQQGKIKNPVGQLGHY